VVFEMLAGSAPFTGGDVTGILSAIIQLEPAYARLPSNVPAELLRLIERCLRTNPRARQRHMRHALLPALYATTCAVAPVAGFGWLILAMGVALCGPSDVWLRRAYVGIWLLVLIYSEVPWAGIVLDWVG
jgi:hypothetical protein